jgi:hypothetical protein
MFSRDVPPTLRALDTLVDPDYADVFTATATEPPTRPLEAWLRSVLSRAPTGLSQLPFHVQRHVLRLRLDGRPSDDRLIGWPIAARGDDWLRLEATGPLMTGHLVFHADGRQLAMATFVRYEHRLGALVWPPVSLLHRQVGLAFMRRAAAQRAQPATGAARGSRAAARHAGRHAAR